MTSAGPVLQSASEEVKDALMFVLRETKQILRQARAKPLPLHLATPAAQTMLRFSIHTITQDYLASLQTYLSVLLGLTIPGGRYRPTDCLVDHIAQQLALQAASRHENYAQHFYYLAREGRQVLCFSLADSIAINGRQVIYLCASTSDENQEPSRFEVLRRRDGEGAETRSHEQIKSTIASLIIHVLNGDLVTGE